MTVVLRPGRPTDLDAILTLNQGALEGVGTLEPDELVRLVDMADRTLVATDEGDVAGFAITLAPGSDYASINYRWFEKRFTQHRYLDRIVIAPAYRRRGIASRLYDDLEGPLPVTLEVYVEPPNVPSLAFHAARGYEEIGRLPQANGKIAAMLIKRKVTP